MGSSPTTESFFSSSGFASSGRSGASGGTGVAGEAETIEPGGKMLAGVSSMSWCSRDWCKCWGVPELAFCFVLISVF